MHNKLKKVFNKTSIINYKNIDVYEYHEKGFCIKGKTVNFYKWEDIIEIIALKKDLYTYDSIYLHLKFNDDDCIEVNEESSSWSIFIQQMEKHLDVSKDWLINVMQPPFKKSESIIYSKQ